MAKIKGSKRKDRLTGTAGNDFIDGRENADRMTGLAGDDVYVVDDPRDKVFENPGEGNDTIQSYVSYTLGANQENLILLDDPDDIYRARNGLGNELDNRIEGNRFNNLLLGGKGNDTLVGGGGQDTMEGGDGDDHLSGDGGEDRLEGGRGNDVLDGGADDDLLFSGIGDDRMLGGDGADSMFNDGGTDTLVGGRGDDYYRIQYGDTVVERDGEGTDSIVIGYGDPLPSHLVLALGEGIEGLYVYADGTSELTGNELNNFIFGGGGDSDDVIDGRGGHDLLRGEDGDDLVIDMVGNGLLSGDAGNDTLIGGDGNQMFCSGVGNDIIETGAGADIIGFNTSDGIDRVAASTGSDNTISIGNTAYAKMAFMKDGSDLVLTVSARDQLILEDWYESDANRSVARLQVVLNFTDSQPQGNDPMRDQIYETFDFIGLAGRFDQAREADPTLTSWNLSNALLDFHLGGSSDEAFGGAIAFLYATAPTWMFGFQTQAAEVMPIIADPDFGVRAQ